MDNEGEQRSEEGRSASVAPETHGDQVRAGVARAGFLDRLLREPPVSAVLDELACAAIKARAEVPTKAPDDPAASAVEDLFRRALATHLAVADPIAALVQELGLEWQGSWLPEFLVAAAEFRRALDGEDLRGCALGEPGLAGAREAVRSWRWEVERHSWMPGDPV